MAKKELFKMDIRTDGIYFLGTDVGPVVLKVKPTVLISIIRPSNFKEVRVDSDLFFLVRGYLYKKRTYIE